jgi:hypothetical protein
MLFGETKTQGASNAICTSGYHDHFVLKFYIRALSRIPWIFWRAVRALSRIPKVWICFKELLISAKIALELVSTKGLPSRTQTILTRSA